MEVYSNFEFTFDKGLDAVYNSLLPELELSHHRTISNIQRYQDSLILTIESNDLVSMRAALNGWLRLIKIAIDIVSAIEN